MARMQFSLRENCCTARFQAWAPTFPPKGGNPFTGFTGFYWFYGQKDRPLPTDAEILWKTEVFHKIVTESILLL